MDYGLQSNALLLLKSYPSDRRQYYQVLTQFLMVKVTSLQNFHK